VGKNIGGCGENRKICCRCGQRQRERRKDGEEGVKAGESLALITGGQARRRGTMDVDERLHYRVRGRRNMCYQKCSFSDA
jgi:hypothetical protein